MMCPWILRIDQKSIHQKIYEMVDIKMFFYADPSLNEEKSY